MQTTLIRSLIKHYTRHNVTEVNGPVTVVTSRKQRITLIDCPNDVCAMMDVAKVNLLISKSESHSVRKLNDMLAIVFSTGVGSCFTID